MLRSVATATPTVTLVDIEAAAVRIGSRIAETPCLHAPALSQLTGAEIFVKF